MNKITAQITTVLFLMLSVFLMGMEGTGTVDDGQESLATRQRELQARIETLKSEQELLLFQKQFSAIDSRYVVLDLARSRGRLKYRSRVFLDFKFRPLLKGELRTLSRGAQVLTKKIEKKDGRFALVFGRNLVVRTKNTSAPGRSAPQIIVPSREMRSIFFALEEGSIAYILR